MLKKQSLEYVVFCVHVTPYSHKSVVFLICLLWKNINGIIKIKSTLKIQSEQSNTIHIQDLSIGNTDIKWQITASEKMTFSGFDTKSFAKKQ